MSQIQNFLNASGSSDLTRRDTRQLIGAGRTAQLAAAHKRVSERLAHIELLARQAETAQRGEHAMTHIAELVTQARVLANGDEFAAELVLDALVVVTNKIKALI